MKIIAVLALSAACLVSVGSSAADVKVNPFKATLTAVAAAEMPAKAAGIVKHAKARDWGNTTVNVVKAALEVNPASAPAVVGAIARAVPEMAAVAASTAAELQPQQASAIARAASAAAPGRAGRIVAAVCRVAPGEFRNVASAASEVAPDANKDILRGVASALPETKSSVDRVMVGYSGVAPVSQVISQVVPAAQPAAATTVNPLRLSQGPTTLPPYVGGSSSGTNVTTSTSGVGASKDHPYSAP